MAWSQLQLHPGIRETDIIRLQLHDLPSAERIPVVRPQDADPKVKTPEHMWTGSTRTNPSPEVVMVRQEYYNVLSAILWSLYRQSQAARLKDDFPLTHSAEEDMDSNTEEAREEIPLCIPNDMPDISKEATLPNPFEHPRHGHFYRRGSALIITGFPGIGKTLFLSVIFYLRVAAKLPTAYMHTEHSMLVYDGHQLFVLRDPDLVKFAGCLDSPRLQQSKQRLPESVAWPGKITGPRQFCLMRPWSLEELFTASSLRSNFNPCLGKRMQAFFNMFGGSAWHVYRDSSDLSSFELLVDAAARSLNRELVRHVMTYPQPTVAVDHRVGHMLITALPLNDKDRTKFQMKSPTEYLEEKLLKQLNRTLIIARRELYIINVGVEAPGCKATADLLDRHHHRFIGLGGKWRLREFTKVEGTSSTESKTNLWQASKESDWFLRADSKMTVYREVLAPRTQTPATKSKRLTMVDFPSANFKQLQLNCYYRPTETNFPTLDSFYMDRNGHGITFQAAESDILNGHSVKEGGREWLEQCGITKFTYILVSRPKMGDPSISVPRDQETKFDHFFHLVLDYPELKKLLLAP
ncbi:hypothetical protein GGX14DRAFT_663370 [Mycena pura]|uniref:Uncharacterized protein n=1 Tax=Mycena pura TaxID=153505 RepID=A0AAD7E037_9AGAR|nr:hypothetical protein GGX14DRAFT_663370 [Mycena pura]